MQKEAGAGNREASHDNGRADLGEMGAWKSLGLYQVFFMFDTAWKDGVHQRVLTRCLTGYTSVIAHTTFKSHSIRKAFREVALYAYCCGLM